MLPHGHKQFVGIGGVHDHVGYAGSIVGKEDFVPGFTTIGGFEDAPFRMFCIWIANGTCINGIGVGRIYDDAVDITGFLKPHLFPALAAVDGLVHPFSKADRVSRVAFTCSYPNG